MGRLFRVETATFGKWVPARTRRLVRRADSSELACTRMLIRKWSESCPISGPIGGKLFMFMIGWRDTCTGMHIVFSNGHHPETIVKRNLRSAVAALARGEFDANRGWYSPEKERARSGFESEAVSHSYLHSFLLVLYRSIHFNTLVNAFSSGLVASVKFLMLRGWSLYLHRNPVSLLYP